MSAVLRYGSEDRTQKHLRPSELEALLQIFWSPQDEQNIEKGYPPEPDRSPLRYGRAVPVGEESFPAPGANQRKALFEGAFCLRREETAEQFRAGLERRNYVLRARKTSELGRLFAGWNFG